MKLKISPNKPLILAFFGVIFSFLVISSVMLFIKYREATGKLASMEGQTLADLVARVGKHVLLPEGETPTVVTVTDKEKLSGQAFFANAKNGDKVLVYEQAKKAYLYDPARDLVLEIGPVTFGATATASAIVQAVATASAQIQIPEPSSFYLYNGTSIVGLTRRYETILKNTVPGAVVVDRDNAKKNDYQNSLLIDLKGSKVDQASLLAKSLNLEVSSLPAGEVIPATDSGTADFLIIVGADKSSR